MEPPECWVHPLIHALLIFWISLVALTVSWFLSYPFSAFNNILSNLGHVLLGFLFLLIVLHRDILHRRALEAKDIFAMVREGWLNWRWELGRAVAPNRLCQGEGPLVWWCLMDHWRLEARASRFCAPPLMAIFLLTALSPFPGVWDSQTLWSLLCHGHRIDHGRSAQCLLPRLP